MNLKISKIGVSIEADQCLDRMLSKINDDFSGGKVTKNDLASWIITYFERDALSNCLDKIRSDHFDQVAYLESVVKEMKQAKRSGSATPDLTTLLAPISSQIKTSSVQSKRRLRGTEIKDDSARSELGAKQSEIQ